MHSHKLNGPGLKYELAICLKTGKIVWVNGPFIGSTNDGTIFRQHGLSDSLFPEEAVEVDGGCKGNDEMKNPNVGMSSKERKMKSKVQAQHEAVNGCLKQFDVLTTHFRHMKPNGEGMMAKHGRCFNAVAAIVQLRFMLGENAFDEVVDYDVNYFQTAAASTTTGTSRLRLLQQ